MKIKKIFIKAVSIVLVMVSVFAGTLTSTFAASKSQSELNKEKTAIQKEIDAANAVIKDLKSETADKLEYVAALKKKIALVEQQIQELEEKVEKLKAEIVDLEAQIEVQQQLYDQQFDEYCQRLSAMYVSGSVTNFEVLLTAPDLSDLLTRAEMVKSVAKSDQEALETLIKSMEEIKAKKETMESNKKEVTASLNQVEANKTTLVADRATAEEAIAELDKQIDAYTEKVHESEEEMEAIDKELKAIIAANSAKHNIISGTGQFTHPCPNYVRMSGGYPNYSNGSYHGGVDFAAPIGTSIVAADSGTVISVRYLTYSYGYHLMIAHGDGLVTLYAHTSRILVSEGQNVSKGQKIAEVGSTGNSTGPHLHFEVRSGGSRVNPLSYL